LYQRFLRELANGVISQVDEMTAVGLSSTNLLVGLLIELTGKAEFLSQMNPFTDSQSADSQSVEIEARV